MKKILNYIIEQDDKYGDPDRIVHHKKIYDFDSEYARAFIFNKKENNCLWSNPGSTHNDILFDLDNSERRKFCLYKHDKRPIRFVEYLSEEKQAQINKCGRIWVIPNDKSKHRKFDVYIAWWNELSKTEFKKFNDRVIALYNKEFNYNIESYIAIDNNGKFVLVEPDGNEITIDKRDEKRKEDVEILKCIHLATQEEKREFFKGFKKARTEHFQKTRYNHTDSKTAAEFHDKYVSRYDPISGKMSWGKNIGDSLIDNTFNKHNMKSLIEYILEKRTIGFEGVAPKYGECVILAGGAASGKGFIQDKIDMTGKVFDVDELKKKYQKMAKAGIFKDDKEYDLTNPDDVAELHQKVKDTGMKSKERNNFWAQRDKKSEKHSSGLLPNVIFDMVSDNIKDIEDVVTLAKANGYHVTLVWVVCNKDTAIMNNAVRGIDKAGKARKVPEAVLDKGHTGAYTTITDLLSNKYPELNEFIDIAWYGFSAGWGRMLDAKYDKNMVYKVKKSNNKFSFNKNEIDEFLKVQQPINYDIDDEINTSLASFRDGKKGEWGVKKYEYFAEHAKDFDESKMPEKK